METKVEKETKVYQNDMVDIVYTGKSSYHKAGDKDNVHRLHADKLIQKGVAKLAK